MEQKRSKFGNWLRNSITARMLVVGLLLLVLLIPLEFVKRLIQERAYRQEEVVREINDKWGNEITVSGPILKIPYKVITEERIFDEKAKAYFTREKVNIKNAYFFPDELDIDANVTTKPLNRSIYESVVYTSEMDFTGHFNDITFADTDISEELVLWEKATILIKTSNTKGIKNTLEVTLAEETLAMTGQYDQNYLSTIQSTPITGLKEKVTGTIPFSFRLKINGSESLRFIPIGKQTTASMSSNWHSPSFDGQFLPDDESRDISSDGFKAAWSIPQISRRFEQTFFGHLPNLDEFAFGTKFIIPVDEYQKSERSAKYGFMVIGLTLLVFLLIQLASRIYIHPFQYIMIGLALVMFYTLLISISEHSTFLKAYAIAGGSVLLLITLYSQAILRGFRFPLLVCASLGSIYGFIYVIIQLENYALLVGSIGLFVILAIIMFASRKIDWGGEA